MRTEEQQRFKVNARRRAMDLLARREHTRQELFLKLKMRLRAEIADVAENPIEFNHNADCSGTVFDPDQFIHQVLDQLETDGLLSNSRFVESYLTARKNKGYGPLYIRHQLQKKHVDDDGLSVVADIEQAQWQQALRALVKKRLGSNEFPQRGTKDYLKLQRFVLSRGFSVTQWSELEKHPCPDPSP